MRPAISVVMPVYNMERHIRASLLSILNQTMTDWELIVVDDGSTDLSLRVVESVKVKMAGPERIRVIKEKHGGCAHATHRGIQEARAPIITVVDSDDISYPCALEAIVHTMYSHRKLGFMWSRFEFGPAPGKHVQHGWSKDLPREHGVYTLLESFVKTGWWGAQHQRALRKEVYMDSPGLDTSLRYAVDLQLAVVMAVTKCPTAFLNHALYWYRRHRSQITGLHQREQKRDHKTITTRLRTTYAGHTGGQHMVVPMTKSLRQILHNKRLQPVRRRLDLAVKPL